MDTPGADIMDVFGQERLANAKVRCVVILGAGQQQDRPGPGEISWEQGRRKIQLQARDLLLAACHLLGGSGVTDLRILCSGVEEAEGLAADDADTRADIFFYEVRELTGDGFI